MCSMHCVVNGCGSSDADAELSFHAIPWEQAEIAQDWVTSLTGAGTASENLSDLCYVCSRHFTPDDLQRDDKVPTVFDHSCKDVLNDIEPLKRAEFPRNTGLSPSSSNGDSADQEAQDVTSSLDNRGMGVIEETPNSPSPIPMKSSAVTTTHSPKDQKSNVDCSTSSSSKAASASPCPAFLSTETEFQTAWALTQLNQDINDALNCDKPDIHRAVAMLEKATDYALTRKTLFEVPDFVETVQKYRSYHGNPIIRSKSEVVFDVMKQVLQVTESATFNEVYLKAKAENEDKKKHKVEKRGDISTGMLSSLLMRMAAEHESRTSAASSPVSSKASPKPQSVADDPGRKILLSLLKNPDLQQKESPSGTTRAASTPTKELLVNGNDREGTLSDSFLMKLLTEGAKNFPPISPGDSTEVSLSAVTLIETHPVASIPTMKDVIVIKPTEEKVMIKDEPGESQAFQGSVSFIPDIIDETVNSTVGCNEPSKSARRPRKSQNPKPTRTPLKLEEEEATSSSDSLSLVDHTKVEVVQGFACRECGFLRQTLEDLQRHIEVEHSRKSNDAQSHHCLVCGKTENKGEAESKKTSLKNTFRVPGKFHIKLTSVLDVDIKAGNRNYEKICTLCIRKVKRVYFARKIHEDLKDRFSQTQKANTQIAKTQPKKVKGKKRRLSSRPSAGVKLEPLSMDPVWHCGPVKSPPSTLTVSLMTDQEINHESQRNTTGYQALKSLLNPPSLASMLGHDMPSTSMTERLTDTGDSVSSSAEPARPKRPRRSCTSKSVSIAMDDFDIHEDQETADDGTPDSGSLATDKTDSNYEPPSRLQMNVPALNAALRSSAPQLDSSALELQLFGDRSEDDSPTQRPKRRRKHPMNVTASAELRSQRARRSKQQEDILGTLNIKEEPVDSDTAEGSVEPFEHLSGSASLIPSGVPSNIAAHFGQLEEMSKGYIELPWKNGRPEYRCVRCGQPFFTIEGIEMHTKCHPGNTRELCCCVCCFYNDRLPRQWRIIRSHLVEIHGINPVLFAQFPCPIPGCPSLHISQSDRERHLALGHRMVDTLKVGIADVQHRMLTQGLFDYTCLQCNTQLHSAEAFEVHLKCHVLHSKGYRCYLCGYSHPSQPGSWRFMRGHLFKEHVPDPIPHETFHYHECTRYTCRIKFCSATARQIHEACHHDRDESTFRCTLCPVKPLLSWDQEARHIIEFHPYLFEPLPFTCSCSAVYHSYNEMLDHITSAQDVP